MKIKQCRSCSSKNFQNIINLGAQPWCNNFLKKKDLNKEQLYPLNLVQCMKCELLQLDYTVPKEIMFDNHSYLSSTTKTLRNFFFKLAKENKKQFNLKKYDKIIDIGGNDGTQLLQYHKLNLLNCTNIESAKNISKISKNNGIKTINNYFNYNLVKDKFKKNSVKLINASGVFFHLEELHSVLKGIKYCLNRDNGILIVQFMYAGSMIKNLNFDTIYHEHLCLYTLRSLNKLLSQYDIEIFDAYETEIHSGSIIAKATFKDSKANIKTERYKTTLVSDKKYSPFQFKKFGNKAKLRALQIKTLLTRISKKKKNNKIYAYGAPAKGNTLINYLNLNTDIIQKCVEVNKLKIGKYLPKSHIPIVNETNKDIPDYYLLLSHNFTKEIISKNRLNIKKGLKFITPFPKLKIIPEQS